MVSNEESKLFLFRLAGRRMRESAFQAQLIKELRHMFPGCYILKNDTDYLQGIPDLLILYKKRWAMLEVKRKPPRESDFEPNQEWYLDQLNQLSFAACIYPENQEEVLGELQLALSPRRSARVSKR
jgi:hypothetical protein